MSDEVKMNRPQVATMRPEGSMSGDSGRGGSKMPWIVLAVIVIVVVVLGVLFRDKLFKSATKTASTTSNASYQAVFLANGQVYFGKLSDSTSDYATLKDIYYLQVVQPLLQGQQTAGQTAPTTGDAQPQISLVKLGNELHGPVDEMHISRTQILFYEDLKDDGSVVKAIKAYKDNPSGSTTPAPVK